ncbi:hypothetical protein ABEB36_001346 [Hypothenemus hampei]|uniref:Transcription initiation protein SPT3 homolog n=1 Tax=Hypothenemus hampei TaxID=57062 RepID=A0ABD1FE94_HYPHA
MANKKITHQICMMMYGFGDSHVPNPETVRLVENIVQKQLRTIVNEALKHWDGKMVKGQELVFLLRHNKHKMQRFVKYIRQQEVTRKLKSTNPSVINIDPDDVPKNPLIEFIERLDETGEFLDTSEIDETKIDRLLRADRISKDLNEEKYIEFQRARCASFRRCQANFEHIKQWIDPTDEVKFTQEALEVLCYFAYQTVAEIVDYALLVREDAQSGNDPLSHLPGSYYTATMFNAPHGLERKKIDCTRIHTNQPPISPNEIKEVMRRVHTPQAGKLNFGGKVPETHYLFAL